VVAIVVKYDSKKTVARDKSKKNDQLIFQTIFFIGLLGSTRCERYIMGDV